MRPKSMVLILIALACGLVASIGISQVVDKKAPQEQTQTMAVYVAASDVPIHETLSATMVRREEWPIDRIPPGAITKLEEIDGQKPAQPFYKGEVILAARLVDPNSRVMNSSRIPKGFRVVSVKVNMDSAVSGLLSPGDRVDVIGYFKQAGRGASIQAPKTQTILTDVTVFAVNSQISRSTEEENDASINAKTVSLTVTPKQAQRLLLAAELGTIKLTLRSLEDDSNETPEKTSFEDLSPSRRTNFFTPQTPVNVDAGFQANSAIKMEVMSPTTRQEFLWTDRNSLPEEIGHQESPIPTSSGNLEATLPVNTTGNDSAGGGTDGFDFDSLADEGAEKKVND